MSLRDVAVPRACGGAEVVPQLDGDGALASNRSPHGFAGEAKTEVTLTADNERLGSEVELLREELRIRDASHPSILDRPNHGVAQRRRRSLVGGVPAA